MLDLKPRTQGTLYCKALYLVFKGKGTYTLFIVHYILQNQGIKETKEIVELILILMYNLVAKILNIDGPKDNFLQEDNYHLPIQQ